MTRCHGIQPREGPGGWATLAIAVPATRKPRGKEPGRGDKAHLWSDEGTVAALEFSQPSLSRRGTGTWQPRRGGPDLRAGGRGGAVALGPPERQSFHTVSRHGPGTASEGPGHPRRALWGHHEGSRPPRGEGDEWHPARGRFHQGRS